MVTSAPASNVAVQAAVSQLGKPYVFGQPLRATNPDPSSFDCSGLTMWCWKQAGYNLSHWTVTQQRGGKKRPFSEAQPGDLVFFGNPAYHVGILASPGTIIEAPDYGIPVRYRNVDEWTTDIQSEVRAFPGTQGDTNSSLLSLVQQAGFTGQAAQTMAAIVLAESGGNPNAHNYNVNTGDNSYGLAQINMFESLGPERRKEFHLNSNTALFNPLTNLRIAFALSGGGRDFTPWSTYNSGAYRNELSDISGATLQGVGSGGPNTPMARSWDTENHWTTYKSLPLRNPPAGTVVYGTPTGNTTSDTSGDNPANYPASKDNDVFAWISSYWDDGSFNKTYGKSLKDNTNMTHDDLRGHLYTVVATQPKLEYDEVGGVADPGRAEAGIGPTGVGSLISALLNAVKWLTNVSNWKRVGLFVLGAVVLIFAAVEMFKG
jgi:hypothetical protein